MHGKRFFLHFARLLLASWLAASAAWGDPGKNDFGKREYDSNCASCHGALGKGDGPYRPFLKKSPSDLTLLAKENLDVFPYQRVYEVIDGRRDVPAHGGRDMPVWGSDYLKKSRSESFDVPYDAESYVRARISALIDYVSRLQQAGGGTAEQLCPGTPNVRVRPAGERGARAACAGATQASDFLAAQGFSVDESIQIVLVEVLPPDAGESAIGAYFKVDRRAYVLSYAAFAKRGDWSSLSTDLSLYESLVAHEIAHAIAADNFKAGSPSAPAQEYVAYVTMFATMAPGLRKRLLKRFPKPAYRGDWQMSTTIYLLDPLQFGARAYRHFLDPANGRRYLQEVLAGQALAEP